MRRFTMAKSSSVHQELTDTTSTAKTVLPEIGQLRLIAHGQMDVGSNALVYLLYSQSVSLGTMQTVSILCLVLSDWRWANSDWKQTVE